MLYKINEVIGNCYQMKILLQQSPVMSFVTIVGPFALSYCLTSQFLELIHSSGYTDLLEVGLFKAHTGSVVWLS